MLANTLISANLKLESLVRVKVRVAQGSFNPSHAFRIGGPDVNGICHRSTGFVDHFLGCRDKIVDMEDVDLDFCEIGTVDLPNIDQFLKTKTFPNMKLNVVDAILQTHRKDGGILSEDSECSNVFCCPDTRHHHRLVTLSRGDLGWDIGVHPGTFKIRPRVRLFALSMTQAVAA